MKEKIDPKSAVRLRKRTIVIVSWYHTSTGFRFGAGRVLRSNGDRLKLLLMIPCEKAKVIDIRIRHHRLQSGRTEYVLYAPTEKELESTAKLYDKYQSAKLGWRWRAMKRHTLLSDWRYWALRRILELSKWKR